jgi:hypothetical protein
MRGHQVGSKAVGYSEGMASGRVRSSMKELLESNHGDLLVEIGGAASHQRGVVVTSHLFGRTHGDVRPGGSIKWAAVG